METTSKELAFKVSTFMETVLKESVFNESAFMETSFKTMESSRTVHK